MGGITPAGPGIEPLKKLLREGKSGLGPLSLFFVHPEHLFPAGQVVDFPEIKGFPRTHQMALAAAQEALASETYPPDAVIIGVTTGGMLTTEACLKQGVTDPEAFAWHGAGSVAECVAKRHGCKGPVITISTACSSGTAAVIIALEMLRTGCVQRVLAGGADSLCRLTYHGFRSLQLIDPAGARPLDIHRRGMSVGEGAALLLLESGEIPPKNAIAQVLGGGLSCDAYHPTTPHPEGEGAFNAMRDAIQDAGLSPQDIDYINLHGTGTVDNDLSEARAVKKLLGGHLPALSSTKGALGHSLAASGGVEAVIAAICVSDGILPASTGCGTADPGLGLNPVRAPSTGNVRIVLSNSFGFGGNNAAIAVGHPSVETVSPPGEKAALAVMGYDCVTGAGDIHKTIPHILTGNPCSGILPLSELSKSLDPGVIRRLKRLPRTALALAEGVCKAASLSAPPSAVFWGTGWGPLSETYDFIKKLYDSDEFFASPTDFIGSVHNAPAGLAALHLGSTGPNITTTGGDYSFEQALMTASFLAGRIPAPFLVMGADEFHQTLSPLFDPSAGGIRSDGGGAFCVKTSRSGAGLKIYPAFFEGSLHNPGIISALIQTLGGARRIAETFGGILIGIPRGCRPEAETQVQAFVSLSHFKGPVIDYRRFTGEFASASAVAAVLGAAFVQNREIPSALHNGHPVSLAGKGILILGFGKFITAVEITC